MRAEIESIAGVLRVFADGKEYGDPYEWSTTVRWLKADEIEIMGCSDHMHMDIWRAIHDECQRRGIKRVLRVSYHDGVRRERWIEH